MSLEANFDVIKWGSNLGMGETPDDVKPVFRLFTILYRFQLCKRTTFYAYLSINAIDRLVIKRLVELP